MECGPLCGSECLTSSAAYTRALTTSIAELTATLPRTPVIPRDVAFVSSYSAIQQGAESLNLGYIFAQRPVYVEDVTIASPRRFTRPGHDYCMELCIRDTIASSCEFKLDPALDMLAELIYVQATLAQSTLPLGPVRDPTRSLAFSVTVCCSFG
jgi:hypothetical protein